MSLSSLLIKSCIFFLLVSMLLISVSHFLRFTHNAEIKIEQIRAIRILYMQMNNELMRSQDTGICTYCPAAFANISPVIKSVLEKNIAYQLIKDHQMLHLLPSQVQQNAKFIKKNNHLIFFYHIPKLKTNILPVVHQFDPDLIFLKSNLREKYYASIEALAKEKPAHCKTREYIQPRMILYYVNLNNQTLYRLELWPKLYGWGYQNQPILSNVQFFNVVEKPEYLKCTIQYHNKPHIFHLKK